MLVIQFFKLVSLCVQFYDFHFMQRFIIVKQYTLTMTKDLCHALVYVKSKRFWEYFTALTENMFLSLFSFVFSVAPKKFGN